MLVVGLTGGIASGKSTVSRMFQEAGIPVICLDELAREAVRAGSPALAEIREVFGVAVIGPDGELDRQAMAQVVFQDASRRRVLESIVHPRVGEETQRRVEELQKEGCKLVVLDVPLLYEVGWEKICDKVVVVYAPREIQEGRLRQRDGLSAEQARTRLDAQMPIEEKKTRAHYVIDNSSTLDSTRGQFENLLEKLRRGACMGE